ncbi:uncharacterized protein LOC114729196 [Neltuma alba]|uniref:uncharacterized protein LOC114729196 n=1 Tax=Neltuma alba TaxID=207710 RepID=UPI0010A58E93|nr:uncharacterized protein LOC114729196 [Prosopis alba]XP_028772006.1 uncharacterized protein LOC114729196 [Prosopis alba]
MARSVARTLTLSTKSMSPLSRLLPHRNQSNQPSSSDVVDVDAASCNTDPLIRKLEDAIQCIIVRRSAPDWLPFYPGASYWVPPPSTPSNGLANLLHNLTDPPAQQDSPPLTSPGAWPSPSYFIQGSSPHPTEIEATSNCNACSEDEEG